MSSQIRPKVLLRYGRVSQPLRVPTKDLLIDPQPVTYLTNDTASGVGTLTVLNIAGFAINQILLIGEPGNQYSEIIKTDTSTAPTGTTITLVSNTVNAHSAGESVYRVLYDQVEFSHTATVAGVKSVLATSAILADAETTNYNDAANSAGFYFARFKNTIASSFSDYSDPVPYAGYTKLSARYIIDSALKEMNKKQSEIFSDEFGFMQINNCQTEVLREMKRWSFMQSFRTNIGTASTGTWRVALPSDIDDTFTNKSSYNFKLGTNPDMNFVDKTKWDELTYNIAWTTLAAILNVGDSSMTLTSSGDFGASGTVTIGQYTYSFTANNTSTNVLTLTAVVPSGQNQANGSDVFSGAAFGQPNYYTIFNGYAYFYPGVGSTYNGMTFWMDYYKSQTTILLDSDVVVLPDPTVVIYYLQWKYLVRQNNGEETETSLAKKALYEERKKNLRDKDSIGRTFRLRAQRNDIIETFSPQSDTKLERVGNWLN